jgi:glycosyltransferase involved in cell wall biosynthesis
MGTPVFSVLITTYNYGRFIEESIESVLSQDYPRELTEVLIVDDGSTDDTARRVEKYASRVRYLRKPNGGQASALNLGFMEARGEIIALLDADDYWLPGKIRRVVEEFQMDPDLGMVYHPFLEFDMQTGEQRASTTFLPISGWFFGNEGDFFWYHPPGTSTAYRRKALDRVLPIPENIKMLADGYIDGLLPFYSRVLAIPECLAAYRFHGKNNFHVDELRMPAEVRRERLRKRQILLDAKLKWLARNGYSRKQAPVRSFLDRWTLYQEKDEFILAPPGRLRFFRHLMLYNRCYGPHLSRRIRLINYLNALGALVTGYKHFPAMDRWRERTAKRIRRLRGGVGVKAEEL